MPVLVWNSGHFQIEAYANHQIISVVSLNVAKSLRSLTFAGLVKTFLPVMNLKVSQLDNILSQLNQIHTHILFFYDPLKWLSNAKIVPL
jgi:hypothetical protein